MKFCFRNSLCNDWALNPAALHPVSFHHPSVPFTVLLFPRNSLIFWTVTLLLLTAHNHSFYFCFFHRFSGIWRRKEASVFLALLNCKTLILQLELFHEITSPEVVLLDQRAGTFLKLLTHFTNWLLNWVDQKAVALAGRKLGYHFSSSICQCVTWVGEPLWTSVFSLVSLGLW